MCKCGEDAEQVEVQNVNSWKTGKAKPGSNSWKTCLNCYFSLQYPDSKRNFLHRHLRIMFVDEDFPPSDVSLWGKGVRRCFEQLEWLRPEELANFSSIRLFDGPLSEPKPRGVRSIRQGLLSDCYLVAAIALLSRRPSLLSQLFVAYKPEEGWCTVRLFLKGKWEEVTLDTFLPCCQGRPAFAHHIGDELYACFLEKACAKAYGSYAALIGGHIDEALWDLTGLAVEEVNLSRAPQDFTATIVQHWEKGDLLAVAWISSGAALQHQHQRVRSNHVYVVADVSTQSVGNQTVNVEVLDLAETHPFEDAGQERTFWVGENDLLKVFNRLSVCHAGMFFSQSHASTSSHKLEVTAANSGGCSNFPTFHKNSMFRVSVKDPQYPQSLAIILSQPDMRHFANELNCQVAYPQIGVTVLCINKVITEVETDSRCCTRNRRKVVAQTPFSSKRNVAVVLQLEPLPPDTEYRVVPSYFFPGDLGMGQLMVHFASSGPTDTISVEQLNPRGRTNLVFDGIFKSTGVQIQNTMKHPEDCSIAGKGSPLQLALDKNTSIFRVTSEAEVTPLTVVLTQRPKESLCWWRRDYLYASLYRCFESFRSHHDNLSLQELDSLCASLFVHMPQVGEDKRKALLARCNLIGQTGRSSVSFGQFLSQILCCGISKSDLQRAADMTATAAHAPATALDAGQVAFIGVAALRNLEQDLDDKNLALSDETTKENHTMNCRASLAAGCEMPVMSDVNVWSASFPVRQSEFYLCPLIRGSEGVSFQLEVQSALDLTVQQLELTDLRDRKRRVLLLFYIAYCRQYTANMLHSLLCSYLFSVSATTATKHPKSWEHLGRVHGSLASDAMGFSLHSLPQEVSKVQHGLPCKGYLFEQHDKSDARNRPMQIDGGTAAPPAEDAQRECHQMSQALPFSDLLIQALQAVAKSSGYRQSKAEATWTAPEPMEPVVVCVEAPRNGIVQELVQKPEECSTPVTPFRRALPFPATAESTKKRRIEAKPFAYVSAGKTSEGLGPIEIGSIGPIGT
eukprot:s15_g40.t1